MDVSASISNHAVRHDVLLCHSAVFNAPTQACWVLGVQYFNSVFGVLREMLVLSSAKQTTLLAMLTGMIPATGGSAFIVGRDVIGDMSNIRNSLGVCPQHDILYPMLTVREHLRLYAVLKGVPHAQLEEAIEVRHSAFSAFPGDIF